MKKRTKLLISYLLLFPALSMQVASANQPDAAPATNFADFAAYVEELPADRTELAEMALDRLEEFSDNVDEGGFIRGNVNRPFPQAEYTEFARDRRLPQNFDRAPGTNAGINPDFTAQEQMDFDTLTRFNNILFAFVVDPDPETRYDPDNFRMVLSMPRHSWVTFEGEGAEPDPVHGNLIGVRHMGIMVCESQGFGMLMLPFMAGAEDMMVPDIRASRGGTGTGANAFMERTVTLGQNLFNNLPEGLQEALRDRYGADTDSVDIQFYFDAMFRTVRQFPSFEINRETGTIPHPRTPNPDPELYRRTYLMSWEISTGIPGIHDNNPANMSSADWVEGHRPTPGHTWGLGNANASFNWFLQHGQPFYDARYLNQSHSIATDGNMDIILGLINADAQWGGGGRGGLNFNDEQVTGDDTVGYLYWAQGMLEDFWLTVVDRTEQAHIDNGWEGNYHLRIGNWSIHEDAYFNDLGVWMSNAGRGSDQMLHHLRIFAEVDQNNDWDRVIQSSYEMQRQLVLLRYDQDRPAVNGNASIGREGFGGVNGLQPDFAYFNRDTGQWNPAPTTAGGWLEGNRDGTFSWNNVRVPWRLGSDMLMTGRNEIDSLVLGSMHSHMHSVFPNFTGIRSSLLDGRPVSPSSGTGNGFWSVFTIAATMDGDDVNIGTTEAERQDWADLAWSHTRRQAQGNNFYADYFQVLAMIVASGNYWSPVETAITPAHYNAVHVRNGYGSGLFAPGTEIELTARTPEGQMVDQWHLPEGVELVEGTIYSQNITVTVPDRDVIINVTFTDEMILGLRAFNNGNSDNASLAAAGNMRIWFQLNGDNHLKPYGDLTFTVVQPNGECGMEFVTVNRIWDNMDYTNFITVQKDGADWSTMVLTVTWRDQVVELNLYNDLFEEYVPVTEVSREVTAAVELVVTRQNGNQNLYTFTVTEITEITFSDGTVETEVNILPVVELELANNFRGEVEIHGYTIYVRVQGNTDVRDLRIID